MTWHDVPFEDDVLLHCRSTPYGERHLGVPARLHLASASELEAGGAWSDGGDESILCALGPHDLDQPFRAHDVACRTVVYDKTVLPFLKAALEDLRRSNSGRRLVDLLHDVRALSATLGGPARAGCNQVLLTATL